MNLIPFEFESKSVRVVKDDKGEPWFVATDVCEALSVKNATQAVARLDEDERSMFNIGRQGEASIINESGLYSLILTSRKPEAKRFKKWATAEVLPSIRKTGSYGVSIPQNLPEALRLAADLAEQNGKLAERLKIAAPKVAALDRIATMTHGSMNLTMTAKHLQVNPKALITWLSANRWIYRRPGSAVWAGYQSKMPHYIEHKVTTFDRGDGTEKICAQVLITAAGIAKLAQEFNQGNLVFN